MDFSAVKVRLKGQAILQFVLLLCLTSQVSNGQQFRPQLVNQASIHRPTILQGAGTRGPISVTEIQWESQKVLPPVLKNPKLIPVDLRNKPPKVHLNYYPDTTINTPRSIRDYFTTTTKPFYPYYPVESRPNTVDLVKPR